MSDNNSKEKREVKEVLMSSTESISLDFSRLFSRPKQKEVSPNNECSSNSTK